MDLDSLPDDPANPPTLSEIDLVEPDNACFLLEDFIEPGDDWEDFDDAVQLLLKAVKTALRGEKIIQVRADHQGITQQSLEKAGMSYQILACIDLEEVWRVDLVSNAVTESSAAGRQRAMEKTPQKRLDRLRR